VNLYNFYLSKCPESVKKQNMFYLQPEESCAWDSPVWYSNKRVSRATLEEILSRLHRNDTYKVQDPVKLLQQTMKCLRKPQEETKKSLKRKSDDNDALRQQQKLASMKSKIDAISKSAEKIKTEKVADKGKAAAKDAKDGGLAVPGSVADTKNRREELLKQLRAVEEAIHRKRSKLDK